MNSKFHKDDLLDDFDPIILSEYWKQFLTCKKVT